MFCNFMGPGRFWPGLPDLIEGDNLTVARTLDYLCQKVKKLEDRVAELEAKANVQQNDTTTSS